MNKRFLLVACIFLSALSLRAQTSEPALTRLDTLFGSNTPERAWWDVEHYAITVTPDYATKTIQGKTTIRYKVLSEQPNAYLQIDLQSPLQIDSIYYNGKSIDKGSKKAFYREGNHYFIGVPKEVKESVHTLTIVYHGKPKEAVNAPWDGGWVWAKDKKGRPWISVACEDDGASTWYPCKDLWSDEPDHGALLTIVVPEGVTAVGNGRLKSRENTNDKVRFTWEVTSPINTYNIIPYIGYYVNWSDTLIGEKGQLDLSYWVLEDDLEKAKKQFAQVKPTLRSFEHWFGPYPFYRDGYKLVQSPYLGMEHQSAVAYGNAFKNGYLGKDLSGTGWGLKWDYIIVHETGHEWFGNNITANDMADMWVHEAFTDYSESLFIESHWGKQAAGEYTQGLRKNILNDRPVIGTYGVRREGSGDMYFKGANLVHTIRQIINNDERFRQILRGLNDDFHQQTVTSKQVEAYIILKSGKALQKVFEQYLRTTKVPLLEYRQTSNALQYRWANVIDGFAMPVKLESGTWLTPTTEWKTMKHNSGQGFRVDKNFYINVKKL